MSAHAIDAKTRLLGLLGFPVGHSVSPAMHNAGFAQLGINACYLAFAVEPELLPQAVAGLRALGAVGFNVTIPHKEAIIPLLDEIDASARLMGAVNTVLSEQGRLIGYNTDGAGFVASLRNEGGLDPEGKRVVVLGAGGSARAIAAALAAAGAGEITVANRSRERAVEVASVAQAAATAGTQVHAVSLEQTVLKPHLQRADLLINCTPVGMAPRVGQSPLDDLSPLPDRALVADIIFNPATTRLMELAQARGLRTLGGLGMLVWQGVLGWEIWFGRRGPVDVMRQAGEQALSGVR